MNVGYCLDFSLIRQLQSRHNNLKHRSTPPHIQFYFSVSLNFWYFLNWLLALIWNHNQYSSQAWWLLLSPSTVYVDSFVVYEIRRSKYNLFVLFLSLCLPFLCPQVLLPCPVTWPTLEAPRRRRTWRRTKRRRKTRCGTEEASTLTAPEAAARPQPPLPATPRPARASSLPSSQSMGMVSTRIWDKACHFLITILEEDERLKEFNTKLKLKEIRSKFGLHLRQRRTKPHGNLRQRSNSLPPQLTLRLLSPNKVFMHTVQQLSWALDTHMQHKRNISSPLGPHSDKHACSRNTRGTMRSKTWRNLFISLSVKRSDPLFYM